MNVWAASGKYDCNFLCVCVLGDPSGAQLATEMGRESNLTHCINGFVDSRKDMPSYGQLGCAGFIVLNKSHQVVSPATAAFGDVRGLAFKHVETLLDAMCAEKPIPRVCPGEEVMITDPMYLNQPAICTGVQGDVLSLVLVQGRSRGKQIQLAMSKVVVPGDEGGYSPSEESLQGSCNQDGAAGKCNQGSCNQGSCNQQSLDEGGGCQDSVCEGSMAGGDCNTKKRPVDSNLLENSLRLKSVKVASMDREHEECALALHKLAKEQSLSALQETIQCLSSHFEDEEKLLEEHGFGGNLDDRFSARATHIKDHKRILEKMEAQTGGNLIPAEFIEELLQDFHLHTSKYDMSYSELLNSRGVK